MQTEKSIQSTAIDAIINEGNAILNLQKFIDPNFEDVINKIAKCNGRLVLTGIGKSAIVAQKITSTLNSTGTPSLFMHAADAVHGDLGMIQQEDIVFIISKSGESPEIKILLPLIKNFGNVVIGIVGDLNSFLAKNSTYIINTSIAEEACPNNLAPTTSTTAQMVMGDVLAICLMQIKGFTSAHFAKYHPGGALGKKLYLTVADLFYTNEKPCVYEDASFKEIIVEISKKRLGSSVVIDKENNIKGIITDGDIRRSFEKYEEIRNLLAKDILNPLVKKITANAMAVDALLLMKQNDITQLVVADGNQFLGIIHLHDIIKEGII